MRMHCYQSLFKLRRKDSAVAKLKLDFHKDQSRKSEISFHFGTIVPAIRGKDSAVTAYQSVIDMNRKADRNLSFRHMLKKAELFDYQNGDFNSFTKTFDKLIEKTARIKI
jgi:hypothetical protein